MALSSLYMVRLIQTWGVGGKQLENVFFFNHTAGAGVAINLAEALETGLLPLLADVQAQFVQNKSIEVINMGTLSDFISYPITGEGGFSGDVLPPYAALGFTMKLNTRAVRHGSKRIAGIPESIQANGVINNTPYLTNVEALRLWLQQEVVSADDTWLPVVVKRVKEAVAGTVPQQYTYRLPVTDGELVLGEVVTVQTSQNLTHQVSRSL